MRDDIDVEYFKKRLEDRLKVLASAVENHIQEGAPKELDQTRVGRLSRMDAMQQQNAPHSCGKQNNILYKLKV